MSHKMNIDELQAMRDNVEQVELSIPEAELCARFEKLYTGAVNDVLREMLLPYQALPPKIIPLRDDMVVCGVAFTVKSVVDPTMTGELESRVKLLDSIQPGNVVVWSAHGQEYAAHWGGVMTQAAAKRGCRGAIVDGGLRDTKEVLSHNFPVWYRYRTSTGALSHTRVAGWQVPIFIGNVIVKPGDIVMADIDGGLVIPRKIAVEVLERAEAIERNEDEIREWVDAGMTAEEIHDRGGYF